MKRILTINGKKFEVSGRNCGSVRMIETNGKSPKFTWSAYAGLYCPTFIGGPSWPEWIQPYVLPLSAALSGMGFSEEVAA